MDDFDKDFDQYCDDREDEMRQPLETMMNEMKQLVEQWK